MAPPTPVRVALDWTPNTNHGGLALAAARGWFAEAGLEVALLSPHADGYNATPCSRLADGGAHFACAPSESVVSAATRPRGDGGGGPAPTVAVAALLQGAAHAVVTRKGSGIDRPARLDGRTYLSYGARYEGRIVQEMIRRDGGTGDFVEATPPMLEIWDRFVKGEGDATWVFMPWEGVLAARAGLELHAFEPAAFVGAYGYSPVLVASRAFLKDSPDAARAFLAAAARGYEAAAAEPEAAADALLSLVDAQVASGAWPPLPAPLERAMLVESAAAVAPHLLDAAGKWGRMDMGRWASFVAFLDDAGLLTAKVQSRAPDGATTASLDELRAPGGGGERVAPPAAEELATNEYLPT